MILSPQTKLFSLPDNQHYLNCAFMSPLLKQVEEAGLEAIFRRRNPANFQAKDFFETVHEVRELFARLIKAKSPADIALIPAVSYAMATIAQNLPKEAGKNIVILQNQFPSNVYIWRRLQAQGIELRTVSPSPGEATKAKSWNANLLKSIDKNTILVTIEAVHWFDGTLFNLEAIGKRAKEVGALFVVDGTQSVGALDIDVEALGLDALVCASYKWLFGPYSLGLAYYGEHLQSWQPIEENWIVRQRSEHLSELTNYQEAYQAGAIRFDVGEKSNFVLMPMLKKALEQIIDWQPKYIQLYCKNLLSNFLRELSLNGYLIEDEISRANHLVGLRLPKHSNMLKIKEHLIQKGVHISIRGDSLRISPHVYNTPADLEVLKEILLEHV